MAGIRQLVAAEMVENENDAEMGTHVGAVEKAIVSSSIGCPPHTLASPVELHMRVGPRALSEKNNLGKKG